MSRFATLIEVAGVSFTGCRGVIIDPGPFKTSYVGSVELANDFSPHPQTVNRGVKGIAFGLSLLSAEQDKLEDVISAVQTSQGSNVTFVVKITEGLYTINVNAVPDYNTDWLTHGKFSEGWYEEVVMRFISKSQGA